MLEVLWENTGLGLLTWRQFVMFGIVFVLLYLGIYKKYEPLLLIPLSFGMFLANFPATGIIEAGGLLEILYAGIDMGIYPPLIFLGVGAMTDFGPLIANPRSLLLGAAAQLGIFIIFLVAACIDFNTLSFTLKEAASISIIAGADGPTAIFLSSILAPHMIAPIAIAAYSYMALTPIIQPKIMYLLTTPEERKIKMDQLRTVSRLEKILFPIIVSIFGGLLVPSSLTLLGMLMFGNLLRECGVTKRLSNTVQNELMNIVTVLLGLTVGATATAESFLSLTTISILGFGVLSFSLATACGVLFGKLMSILTKGKINPLIGAAGVSAVPMSSRVVHQVGQQADRSNYLLMHAMGPNVAGVIGSAIAAGIFLSLLG